MIKHILRTALLGTVALAIVALPAQAADKPEKPAKPAKEKAEPGAKSSRAIPYRGKLSSKTDTSVTIGKRTFEVTAETKIMRDGKAAKLSDIAAGDNVTGQYHKVDGKLTAKSIYMKTKQGPAVKREKAKKAGE